RARLIQLLLTESVMLAALGGTAGLAIAWVTAQMMRSALLPTIEWTSPPVDARVLAVSALIALSVGVVMGLVPALRASRPDLTASLKAGVREGGAHGTRLRAALTVTQAALSIVLLVGAGLFVRSLWRIHSLDLGIQPDRVLVVDPSWPRIGLLDTAAQRMARARRADVFLRALERVRRMPDVEHASLTVGLPFQNGFQQFLRVTGWDSIPHLKGGEPGVSAVASDYFETVGTRIFRGRTFTPADREGSELVAVVNETMAKTLWPGRDPIGDCLFTAPTAAQLTVCARIVGIVGDVHRRSLREEASMQYYVPFGQQAGFGGTSLLIRARGAPSSVVTAARRALVDLDPSIRYVGTQTLQELVDPQIRPWRLGASVFGLMGVLALVVAAAGLYSVMSYLVAQRTRELGVRIALGAGGGNIVALVLRSSLGMAALGVAIGTGLALWAGRFVAPLLFETSPDDPLVIGGVAAVLLGVAVLASLLPALRAKRVDPIEALRAE
ncbi:MAG: FtsX-like permease family protein, partial [Gemmatimonadales bacterium]